MDICTIVLDVGSSSLILQRISLSRVDGNATGIFQSKGSRYGAASETRKLTITGKAVRTLNALKERAPMCAPCRTIQAPHRRSDSRQVRSPHPNHEQQGQSA
jgi:hypothetical protein